MTRNIPRRRFSVMSAAETTTSLIIISPWRCAGSRYKSKSAKHSWRNDFRQPSYLSKCFCLSLCSRTDVQSARRRNGRTKAQL